MDRSINESITEFAKKQEQLGIERVQACTR